MSKINFLEEMFFGSTEKFGREKVINMRTENAANIRIFKMDQKIILGIFGHFFGHFWTFLQKLPN
jgi:hypothetical protein